MVDDLLRTANPRIWAAGDCIGGLQLAHLASAEGARAVENALGVEVRPIDRTVVPSCIYTHPEIAMVGLGVEAARAAGYEVQVGQARFLGNGKALGEGEPDGLVQLCAEAGTGRILGATVMGVHAVEIIHEVGVADQRRADRGRAGRRHSCASHGQRAGDGGGGAGRGPRPLSELSGAACRATGPPLSSADREVLIRGRMAPSTGRNPSPGVRDPLPGRNPSPGVRDPLPGRASLSRGRAGLSSRFRTNKSVTRLAKGAAFWVLHLDPK